MKTKFLLQASLLTIVACMSVRSVSAQTILEPAVNTVVSCNCNAIGYGCFPTAWACKMACSVYCHHLHVGGDEATSPMSLSTATPISFLNEYSQKISLKVYDVSGNLVTTIVDKTVDAGYNHILWDADELHAGVYMIQYQTAENIETQKLLVSN